MMYKKKIRLLTGSLIFLWLLAGCTGAGNRGDQVALLLEQGKATAVSIPLSLLGSNNEKEPAQRVQVQLPGEHQPAILGEYSSNHDAIIFRPVIPFTPGLVYHIKTGNKIIGELSIPAADPAHAATVLAVYPVQDTLPENVLKLYIRFSAPMQEGLSLRYIALVRNGTDTLTNVFLDLDRELWDTSHSRLTLWFDPGRIKRDLQPNLLMGPPLQKGNRYELIINSDWRDAGGASLANSFTKTFIAGSRDSLSPDPMRWKIEPPKAGSADVLRIRFMEPLDYFLFDSSIRIIDKDNKEVEGSIYVNEEATQMTFTSTAGWKAGTYTVEVDTRLEDLAGNTIDHLFDTDLTVQRNASKPERSRRTFIVN